MATKNAGAGRGFVNPQRTDEPDEEYVSPSDRFEMEKQRAEAETQRKTDTAAEEASKGMKKGGKIKHYASAASAVKAAQKRGDKSITVKFSSASKRADGSIERGHTKGHMR
jgi:hypothetical protein